MTALDPRRASPSNPATMSVRVTTLDNGLRVATDPMESVESASIGVWIDAGTRDERPEVNGVAHLIEHMAFKGTRRRSARDIAEEIEAVGGHLNAYTSRESTAFYAKVLRQDLPLAVDILADITLNPTYDPEELERERTVVLQEIGQAMDTPDDIVFDHFQATAFPDQPLGMPVLGEAEVVRGLGRQALVDFREAHYRGPDMIVTAAGRVDHEALVELARSAFGDVPSSGAAREGTARYVGGDYRERKPLEQVHFVLGFEGLGFLDPDYYAQSVFSTVLGGGMSSRLFQEVREARGLVYSIYSFATAFSDCGLFGVYAGTGEAEVGEMVPVVCDVIGGLVHDVREEEVARARAQIKANVLMALESTGARAELLGNQLQIYGRPIPADEVAARIDAVDVAAVRRVAERIVRTRPTVTALGPVDRLEPFERIAARLG